MHGFLDCSHKGARLIVWPPTPCLESAIGLSRFGGTHREIVLLLSTRTSLYFSLEWKMQSDTLSPQPQLFDACQTIEWWQTLGLWRFFLSDACNLSASYVPEMISSNSSFRCTLNSLQLLFYSIELYESWFPFFLVFSVLADCILFRE